MLWIVVLCLCSCQTIRPTNVTIDNQMANIGILAVKNAVSSQYGDKTYGEAFASFFGLPKWRYFKAKVEQEEMAILQATEDTQANIEVVEFIGYCMYQGKRVKAAIQFILDQENQMFRANSLSLNGVPQNVFFLLAVMEKVFTHPVDSTELATVSDADADKKEEEIRREEARQAEEKRKAEEEQEQKRKEEERKREEKRILAEKQKYMDYVKNGSNRNFPNQTYGMAFDTFFSGTNWEYFEGRNNKGEIGKIVEFTGDCYYQNVKTFAKVQFLIDESESTFEVVSFELGTYKVPYYEIPQMINSIFSEVEQETKQLNILTEMELSYDGFWEAITENGFLTLTSRANDFGGTSYDLEMLIYKNENDYDHWVAGGLMEEIKDSEEIQEIMDFMGVRTKYINGIKVEEEILNDIGVNSSGKIYFDRVNNLLVVEEFYLEDQFIFKRSKN